jgi:hypothetical protein
LIGVLISCLLLIITIFTDHLSKLLWRDIYDYYYDAHAMLMGRLPYHGLSLEYPPGVIPLILIAAAIGHLVKSYLFGFITLTMISMGLFLWHCHWKFGWKRVLLVALLILPVLQFTFFELDIFMALTLYGAVYFLQKHNYKLSSILLAASTLIKMYPGVCLLGLIWTVPKSERKRYLSIFFGILAIVLLPVAILAPKGLWHALTYQTGRPIEFEATGAAIGYTLRALGHTAHVIVSHHSWAVLYPGSDLISSLSTIAMILAFLLITYLIIRKRLQLKPAALSLIFLLIFILFFKVGSPQYIVLGLFIAPLVMTELKKQYRPQLVIRLLLLGTILWLQFSVFVKLFLADATVMHGSFVIMSILSVIRALLLAEIIFFLVRSLRQNSDAPLKSDRST